LTADLQGLAPGASGAGEKINDGSEWMNESMNDEWMNYCICKLGLLTCNCLSLVGLFGKIHSTGYR